MSLDFAILGFLAEHPRSGYDLKTRCFDGPVSGFWTADQAQIYRTLDRLATAKAVTFRIRRQSGRPDRRIYELTPAGRTMLDDFLAQHHDTPPLRDPYLLQLWFASELPDENVASVLKAEREAQQKRLDLLRADAIALAREQRGAGRSAMLRGLALQGAISSVRCVIDWLDDSIERVEHGELGGSPRTKKAGSR